MLSGARVSFLALLVLSLTLLATTAAHAAPPALTNLSVFPLTTDSATLHAQIDPSKNTRYHFDYIADAAYQANPEADRFSGAARAPIPDGKVPGTVTGSGDLLKGSAKVTNLISAEGTFFPGLAITAPGVPSATTIASLGPGELFLSQPATATATSVALKATGPQPVSQPIGGLSPGTTYHYRLAADNNDGETLSTEHTFTTYDLSPSFGPCPNDVYRTGPGARLPDCRAYEQATPTDKNGNDVGGFIFTTQASGAGDAITSATYSGVPRGVAFQGFPTYLSRRSGGAWSTSGLLPPVGFGEDARVLSWTPDLSYSLSAPYFPAEAGKTALVGRRSSDGSYATLIPHTVENGYALAGATPGASELFLDVSLKTAGLTPNAASGKPNLYRYQLGTGATGLIGVLPDGTTPPDGSFAGSYNWFGAGGTKPSLTGGATTHGYFIHEQHTISSDGDSAYFTTAGEGQLYLRRGLGGPSPETLHVSASQRGTPDPLGPQPAAFQIATPDGEHAFFTSSEELTDDANTGPQVPAPSIARANLADGSGADLDFLPVKAQGLTVSEEHLYWADPGQGNPGEGTIGRAQLNGAGSATEVEPALITGAFNPQYVTVEGDYVYWTNAADQEEGHGTIGRSKLGPSGSEETEQDFITGASNPQGIDAEGEFIYWSNAGPDDFSPALRAVARATLSGEEADQEFIDVGGSEKRNPQGLAVNSTHIYLIVNGSDDKSFTYLRRFDIDGDPSSQIGLFAGIDNPDGSHARGRGLAIDDTYVYWTREARGTIDRAKLDFTERELGFISDAERPFGLALGASHLYWSANQGSPPHPGNDLYRFDAVTGELTDLTSLPSEENGADVQGVIGASDDGSRVYFVANGDLDGAGPATPGGCQGPTPEQVSGACNLYLSHGGEITFITRLGAPGHSTDSSNWRPTGSSYDLTQPDVVSTARISADGKTLLFKAPQPLTLEAGPNAFYLYRVGQPGPVCIACTATGGSGVFELKEFNLSSVSGATINVASFLSRNLSADGTRVFFQTPEKLLAADTNGDLACPGDGTLGEDSLSCLDVYEWETVGAGTCTAASSAYQPLSDGCLYLLSPGSGPAQLADASTTGDVVFIHSRERLVPQDRDDLRDIYAVSVDGGLAAQHVVSPPPCEGDACRGPSSAPADTPGAASAVFVGPPDPTRANAKPKRCSKGKRKVRRGAKVRCVKANGKKARGRKQDAKNGRRPGR